MLKTSKQIFKYLLQLDFFFVAAGGGSSGAFGVFFGGGGGKGLGP